MFDLVFILHLLGTYLATSTSSENASKNKLPRYVIEADLKPAIVGSYKFDIIKGIFDLERNVSLSTLTTDFGTEALATTNASLSTKSDDSFRKHVALTSVTFNQLNWWTHSKFLKNFTRQVKFTTIKTNPKKMLTTSTT